MDLDLILELRQWAKDAYRLTETRYWDMPNDAPASDFANVVTAQFAALEHLLVCRIRAERERLATAVREAEARAARANETVDRGYAATDALAGTRASIAAARNLNQAEQAYDAACQAWGDAKAALEAFDRRVNGGAS